MDRCLIVETRDPLNHRDFDSMADLAFALSAEGVTVSLLLTGNGVLGARPGAVDSVERLVGRGIPIAVDRDTMQERGLAEGQLFSGMDAADIGLVMDWLEAGATVL